MFQRSTHKAMAVGAGAIPVVSLISFLVGVIIALQRAYELQRLGAMQLVAGLVSVAITRELGSVITAIVVIGRSLSSPTSTNSIVPSGPIPPQSQIDCFDQTSSNSYLKLISSVF